jgi:hypothetical protein
VPVSTYINAAPRTSTRLCAGKRTHPVRGVFDHVGRWGCLGLCHVCGPQDECAYPLDSGSYVAERSGAALFASLSCTASHNLCHRSARSGCSLGDGGRLALRLAGCCDWRGLGRSTRAGLYRHKAPGGQGRVNQSALLAGAPGGSARSECGTQPLAHCGAAICFASPRPASPRRSALAGGIVSLATGTARHVGGNL